jgi:hypothetical protein
MNSKVAKQLDQTKVHVDIVRDGKFDDIHLIV